ncbi:EscS/YscS/HrcS family type III secretion system export apparatus protein [Priestia megaterium]|nr:EscS/YscS/HrcS family type III secretion system export apparatus protein [Priestia megaterium]
MDYSIPIEMFRSFIVDAFIITGPALIVSLVISVIFGIVQAVMQIQEQTLSFFPKLFALFATLYLLAYWMFEYIVKVAKEVLDTIPSMF